MRILFDSHALVWFLSGDDRFPHHLRASVSEAEIVISAVCVWEMATKVARRKWPEAETILPLVDDVLRSSSYTPLPTTIQHARVAAFLPGRHRDPFDRMLAAQSQVEGLQLLSADPAFKELGVPAVW